MVAGLQFYFYFKKLDRITLNFISYKLVQYSRIYYDSKTVEQIYCFSDLQPPNLLKWDYALKTCSYKLAKIS